MPHVIIITGKDGTGKTTLVPKIYSEKITEILQAGIRYALLRHKQANNPICEWRNGEAVWILPEEI